MKRSGKSDEQRKRARQGTQGETDSKVLKSYRLRKSVVLKIETIRIAEGQRAGNLQYLPVLQNVINDASGSLCGDCINQPLQFGVYRFRH